MQTEEFDVEIDNALLHVQRLFHAESDPDSDSHSDPRTSSTSTPNIVFLHDSLGSIELWRDFPERVAKAVNANAIVFDRQGYGQSTPFTQGRGLDYLEIEARRLLELLQKLEASPAILFGHSDGGSIALLAAAMQPEAVRAVISEGAHVFVEEVTLSGIRAAVELYRSTNLKQRLERYHGDKTVGVFDAWSKTWLNPQFRQWNMERYLPLVKCPVLVLQGEKDEYGSIAQVNAIKDQVSGISQAVLVPGVGHTPHKEASDATLAATARFLSRVLK